MIDEVMNSSEVRPVTVMGRYLIVSDKSLPTNFDDRRHNVYHMECVPSYNRKCVSELPR